MTRPPDSLTGLPGREDLLQGIRDALAAASTDQLVGVLFVDLDGFKRVNDSAGHEVGDEYLVQAARTLTGSVGSHDIVARLAGDEFAVLLTGRRSVAEVLEAARTITTALLRTPASVGVTTRHGLAGAPSAGIGERLLREADVAMLTAKRRGGGRPVGFEPAMLARAEARAADYRRARTVVETQAYALGLQPVHDLHTGTVVRVEALLRVRAPDGSLHTPGRFLDVAESTGRMPVVTRWVLENALAEANAWRSRSPAVPISVNVPAAPLALPGTVTEITGALRRAGLPGSALVVEVHRGVHAVDVDDLAMSTAALAEQGIRLLLEDVDATWSLADVATLAPHEVSVGPFSLAEAPARDCLTRALVAVAADLGCLVTAKQIEGQRQLATARERGCHRGQGQALSPVVPPEHIEWRTSHLTM